MRIAAYMLSCDRRAAVRRQTLASLLSTDWGAEPDVEFDQRPGCLPTHTRMAMAVRTLLRRAASSTPQFVLLLEDDLRFNRHLRHNLDRWLQDFGATPDRHFFSTLFNPTGGAFGIRVDARSLVVDVKCAFGSQALLFSAATTHHILEHWDRYEDPHDFRMYRLAAMAGAIYCHVPSLVQHVAVPSTWGGPYFRARDFFADWKAPSASGGDKV